MKIAFDAKRLFHNTSGLGNYSRDLVRILASHFPEHEYLLLAKKSHERAKELLELPNVSFMEIQKVGMARQFKMGLDAQEEGAEIFHGLSGELPLLWNPSPIKKVVTIHDLIFMRFPQFYSYFDRNIHFRKFKKAARSADLVIATSEQTKADIVQFLQIPEEKIEVVYQTCHPAFHDDKEPNDLQELKQKYRLPERFVLNVGTVEDRKNLGNLILALEGTGIPLVVVGKKKKKYFRYITELLQKTDTEVYFLEGMDMQELAAIYALADVFVYPSLFEGFGIPLIEAMYSKTPVITSNTSCLPEVGGPHSLYADPLNVEELRTHLLYLWNNPEERKRRAIESLEYVQKFNEKAIAEKVMNIYQNLF